MEHKSPPSASSDRLAPADDYRARISRYARARIELLGRRNSSRHHVTPKQALCRKRASWTGRRTDCDWQHDRDVLMHKTVHSCGNAADSQLCEWSQMLTNVHKLT